MSKLSRYVEFRFKYSDDVVKVPMLSSIIGMRSKGYRPCCAVFDFPENTLLIVNELAWIEQCVKPALDRDVGELKYKKETDVEINDK